MPVHAERLKKSYQESSCHGGLVKVTICLVITRNRLHEGEGVIKFSTYETQIFRIPAVLAPGSRFLHVTCIVFSTSCCGINAAVGRN